MNKIYKVEYTKNNISSYRCVVAINIAGAWKKYRETMSIFGGEITGIVLCGPEGCDVSAIDLTKL